MAGTALVSPPDKENVPLVSETAESSVFRRNELLCFWNGLSRIVSVAH